MRSSGRARNWRCTRAAWRARVRASGWRASGCRARAARVAQARAPTHGLRTRHRRCARAARGARSPLAHRLGTCACWGAGAHALARASRCVRAGGSARSRAGRARAGGRTHGMRTHGRRRGGGHGPLGSSSLEGGCLHMAWNMQVTDAKKPLASVSRQCDVGRTVMLRKTGCAILATLTGWCLHHS